MLCLGSLHQIIQPIIVQLRKSCFFSLLPFWFQILIKAQIEIWKIFVHFFNNLTAENVSLKVFKFRRETQKNFYVTQPCLHPLMQTRLSANQSARTI